MSEPNVNLSNLFAELKKIEQNGEFEKGIKVSNKILNLSPSNEKAIQCKVVCLIQLNQFEEALKLITQQNDILKAKLNFEKSYCEYRLNKVEQALDTMQNADLDSLGVKELRTQALYRIERFEECYDNYVDLIKNSDDDYEDERIVNLTAVLVGLINNNQSFKNDFLDATENTYEIQYNKACIMIASKKYDTAIKKLNEAEVICRKFLEEDGASEEEIETELAIIRAQIAYCNQQLNKNEIALKAYNQILRQKLSDIALLAVVSNNIVTIHKDQNLFDSKKKIKMAMNDNAEFKLSTSQKQKIHYNSCLFQLNTNQNDVFQSQLSSFKSKYPNSHEILLVESYALVKAKNTKQAIKVLSDYCTQCKTFSEIDLKLIFLLAQLLIKEQNLTSASRFIENLTNFKYHPVVVSVLYLLYEQTEDIKSIESLFKNAIHWHETNKSTTVILSTLYREAAKFYLDQKQPQNSVKHLEKLIQLKGKNPKIISMLINAYSQFDMVKAQKFQNELPSVSEILSSVDIEQLENKNWSLGVKYVKKFKDTPKVSEKKKNKKRKKILPKNYNPNEQPDPERWLPKYERSNYRKKKDKKGVGKGTQGAVGEIHEIKPSPKPVVASPPGPRQQRPTQKKKKKGARK